MIKSYNSWEVIGDPEGYETMEDLKAAQDEDDLWDGAIFEFKGFV